MGLTKYKLGELIKQSTVNNGDLKFGVDKIVGVSSEGVFTTPKGNPLDVNLKPYKIVNNGAFVYTPTRVNIGSIAYRTQGLCIVSHLYIIFYLTDEGKKIIDPIWLYMYLRRKEFQREIDFRLFGSARPEFSYKDMADISITIPSIEEQRKYVDVYLALQKNLEAYQSKVDELKLVCDGYIEELRRNNKCEKIGNDIEERREKNSNFQVKKVLGISKEGFITPKQDVGDLTNYWIFNNNDFVYSPPRINVGSIGLYKGKEKAVCSPIYVVFYVKKTHELVPEYLNMWLHRNEFFRSTDFYAIGSVRNNFSIELMKEIQIPIPSLEIQQSIVSIYQAYTERLHIATQLKEQLNYICPILIKGSLETDN